MLGKGGARAHCPFCGKTRELRGDELHSSADMDAFKDFERRSVVRIAGNGP